MIVHVEDVSPVKKKLNFEIPAERVTEEIGKVYLQIQKTAAMKGFRKGKVPQGVLEKHFSGKMAGDVLHNLVSETYFKALDEQKIVAVSPPSIESDEVKKGEPLKYSATVEILPEIEVKDYTGLQIRKDAYTTDEKIVADRLKEMQTRMAQIKPLDEQRPAAIGDIVTLDFTGYVDGTPFENGSAIDYMLELGSNSFITGFEDQVVGMSTGDEGTIKVTFPEDYFVTKLAGKEVTFDVKIKDIKTKELPPLDDDFASQIGEFETLDQLKAKLSESYETQEKSKIESRMHDRLVQELIEKNPIEVPEALVEKQLQFLVDNIAHDLAMQNLTLAAIGSDEKKIRQDYRDTAVLQVKGTLLLEAVAKKEGIVVEPAEIEQKILDISEKANKDSGVVEKFYEKNSYAKEALIKQLREEKTIKFLAENASITEEPEASSK
ncbi:MAG: trigger factor [Geobacteraceae bacterium]|jgi:trigger factor|nr:trigger factor [Geobacteraceae bacterium]